MLHMAHSKYSLLTYIISYTYLSGVHNVHLLRLHLSKRQYGLNMTQSGAGWSASLNYSQAHLNYVPDLIIYQQQNSANYLSVSCNYMQARSKTEFNVSGEWSMSR